MIWWSTILHVLSHVYTHAILFYSASTININQADQIVDNATRATEDFGKLPKFG